MENQEILLRVNHLEKTFRSKGSEVKAVRDISFHVKKGEAYALVGESGCGKTTTGRLILKLAEADAGEIIFNGIDIGKVSKKEFRKMRSSIQIIFQDPYASLNPRMKIKKLLKEAILCRNESGIDKDKYAEELMLSVGLRAEDLDKYPHEFSGGQRQRICIARAIATNPQLIICDEPVSALDLLVQAQILKLLKELQNKHGFSYIFISHDLAVVRYMSDRIAVMCRGKIVEEGMAEEIFGEPIHSYTKLLLDSVPCIETKLKTEETNKSYYGDKYQEAICDVVYHSAQVRRMSDTHYVLQDI